MMYEYYCELLKKKGVTSYRVSMDTGIAKSVFSDWKKGRCTPNAQKIFTLSKYFGVPMESFFTLEEN